jgi:Gpi18-like mannosyltransferase
MTLNAVLPKKSKVFLTIAIILLAISLRVLLFHVYSDDIDRMESGWYDVFIEKGPINAFKDIFYNYSPPLLYLIDITTFFRFIPKEIAIRLISVIFDFFAAFAFYKIISLRFPGGFLKWIGFYSLLMLPTVFIESGMWGQSDIIYASFLMWTFYFLLREKQFSAIIFFSIAFAFKLQALFFAPIFAILFLRRKFSFWLVFIVPIVYFLSLVPAWLAGGPLEELIMIYFSQFDTYHSLSMRAPNFYLFIPADPGYNVKVLTGMLLTMIVVVGYIIMRKIKWGKIDAYSLCFDAVLLLNLIPFLLPKMHERYFFTGGIFLLLLAFFNYRMIWAAVLAQSSALFAYIPYFTGWSDIFAQIGAVINTILIVALIIEFLRYQKELQITPQMLEETGSRL